jgi:hypothetical protein
MRKHARPPVATVHRNCCDHASALARDQRRTSAPVMWRSRMYVTMSSGMETRCAGGTVSHATASLIAPSGKRRISARSPHSCRNAAAVAPESAGGPRSMIRNAWRRNTVLVRECGCGELRQAVHKQRAVAARQG